MSMDFPSPASEGQFYTPLNGPQYVYVNGAWRMAGAPTAVVTAETRNRVTNPAFQIAQEQASTTTHFTYFADQWQLQINGGAATASRLDAVQTFGGSTYGVITVNTAVPSLAAGNLLMFSQPIEGVRVRDFNWGAATAKPIVISFLARFSVAGTFYVSVRSNSNDASYVAPFTISASEIDVWVTRTISIPGPTIGTWPIDATRSLSFIISLAAGSTYLAPSANQWLSGNYLIGPGATNGFATAPSNFRIANVGLYCDPLATGIAPPWVMPDEAEELRACQRYYQKLTATNYYMFPDVPIASTLRRITNFNFPVTFRAIPTVTGGVTGVTSANFAFTASTIHCYAALTDANPATGSAVVVNAVAQARM